MIKEEYEIAVKELEEKHRKEKRILDIQCAKSNQKYQIGDTITDHTKTTIQIIDIMYRGARFNKLPQAVYYGYVLKKDGTKRKDERREYIWQSNMIE